MGLVGLFLLVPLGDEFHPPPVTGKAASSGYDFAQDLEQGRVTPVKGRVGLLEVVVAAVSLEVKEGPVDLAVLRSEEQLSRLPVKPFRQGRGNLPPADRVDVGVFGEVEDLWGVVITRKDVRVKPPEDQVVSLMNQDKEQVFRAGNVVQEELDPNLQVSPQQVDCCGREGLVESDLVDVFENFRDPLRPLAAVRPIAENFITCQGVNQEGCRPVQVLFL